MACKQCGSHTAPSIFVGEVAIHHQGLKGLDQALVWVFPKLGLCVHCGLTEFIVPETEMRELLQGINPV
jgi:hypothetical protein